MVQCIDGGLLRTTRGFGDALSRIKNLGRANESKENLFFGCRVQNLALDLDQKLNQKSPAGVCESKKWWFDVSHSATTLQWVRLQPNTAKTYSAHALCG